MTVPPYADAVAGRSSVPGYDLRRARNAVYVSFVGAGLVFASWVSRIPQVRDRLRLDPGSLGLLLLSLSVGSVLSLPVAGLVVDRLGTRRTLIGFSILAATGLAVVAVGYRYGPTPVAIGLFSMGLGYGTWDVAMNVEGADVEQRLGRSIMSRFHAGFSVGTVLGALIGAAMVGLHVSVTIHLFVIAAFSGVAVPLYARGFLSSSPHAHETTGEARRNPLKAWTEPRTLLIGLAVMAAAFTEGTGNDWLGVAVIDGYGTSAAIGSLSFAVFVSAMTVARWFGPHLIDRWGRVPVLRGAGALALSGLLVVIFGQALALALAGAVAWGLGAGMGFPVGMSAAADDPRFAAARVGVVSSIGYTAFLAGPPLIGFVGDHLGVLHSLTIATGMVAVGLLVAGSCRELPIEDPVPPQVSAGTVR